MTALAINIFVFFKLHPEIKVIKKEIHSFDTLPGDDPLRKKFKILYGTSAVLNLILLADGVILFLLSDAIRKKLR